MDIDILKRMLELDEGNKDQLYTDSVGKLTIGIGHNIEDKGLRQDEISLIFSNDISESIDEVSDHEWFNDLDEIRQSVIVNMVFNMGMPTVLEFTNMITALKIHDYEVAAEEMLDSKWARQVGERAKRLAYMMESGIIHPAY